jgi:molybdopterin-guanine dinucleotide biosynthesis protein A
MSEREAIEVCVLAGGLSGRMGCNKAKLRLGGRTMLGRVTSAAKTLGLPVRVIRRDKVPRCGPLGGIFTALSRSGSRGQVFLACDMPFVSAELLGRLVRAFRASAGQACFVSVNGIAGFPCFLRRKALPVVTKQIKEKEYSLQQLARALNAKVLRVPARFRSELSNVNTPADWRIALRRWREMGRAHANRAEA